MGVILRESGANLMHIWGNSQATDSRRKCDRYSARTLRARTAQRGMLLYLDPYVYLYIIIFMFSLFIWLV
jgi:hypothetical protein